MNATELQKENERLKAELSRSRSELSRSRSELSQSRSELSRSQRKLAESQAQHAAVAEQFTATLLEKDRKVSQLEHQIKLLLERIKGSRQERINPDQLLLFSVEELQEIATELAQQKQDGDFVADEPARRRRRKTHGRVGKLPAHLDREIIRHELTQHERACPCCGEQREEIGVETSEQLELVPARLKAIEHHRVKYACRKCEEHVVIADKPPQPIEKGLPAPGLCTHTVLSKFGDHQPMYRQEDIHSRLGKKIRRTTLCGWQSSLAQLALPLVMRRMKFLVLQSKVIHTDDTSIKMLEPGRGQTRTCKFWPYLGDWLHPYAVYDFTLSRGRDGPRRFLEGFAGYLQADAYSGYDGIYAGDRVREVACWVHARRYWHQAIDNDPVRANTALGFIARLSQIETQLSRAYPCTNLQGARDFKAVRAGRAQHALPILAEFKSWLASESSDTRILPKSPIRSAFRYTQNQWSALTRYTDEGYLSPSNNAAERLVKFPAIGRKNYLFVGSENGGHGAAVMYSLVSSAKANGVEPFAWLKDVFTRLPHHRDSESFDLAANKQPVSSGELDYLLPDKWLAANPDHKWEIDAIRRAERPPKTRK